MVANSSNRKKASSFRLVGVSLLLVTTVIGAFIFLVFHAHLQLGSQQENTKLFIRNQINKFEESIITEVDVRAKDLSDYIHKFQEKTVGTQDRNEILVPHVPPNEAVPVNNPDSVITNNAPPTVNANNAPALPISHVVTCPHANTITFWQPTTIADSKYRTPYAIAGAEDKYVTFEPDVGGWNNIRMQMETVLVFAAATGRILVLPPDQPMYLLDAGKGHQKAHSFADFFPFDLINSRVPVISMEEFLIREGITGRLKLLSTGEVAYPPQNKTEFIGTLRDDRIMMWEYLRNISACPRWKSMKEFIVIPFAPGVNVTLLSNAAEYKERLDIFAAKRDPKYYDEYWQKHQVIHFVSIPKLGFRILEHFYTFIHFEDPIMGRYYKRFVRDFVHYTDVIFCKAAIIINELQKEGKNGIYSSFHIRRGDFQYKAVKIGAAEMMENVGHHIPENELLFVATDERNKSFFNPFLKRFPTVRYLDDYMEIAGLHNINPNYLGMIDQIVCTRGHIFVGTWFSTFSGYITRMRGYMGYHDHSNYYGDEAHMNRFQFDELPMFPFYMREWNVSWVDIDER